MPHNILKAWCTKFPGLSLYAFYSWGPPISGVGVEIAFLHLHCVVKPIRWWGWLSQSVHECGCSPVLRGGSDHQFGNWDSTVWVLQI
ncbi:hypothetical protein VNO78_05442 [Psophocarpus tetragonolobus]|uniref:Uncharacterized protein n=1 Tax=Psophocarpus tetragonolobus TaxID=3891 RepID=A0AAN9XQQ9_PSOTE